MILPPLVVLRPEPGNAATVERVRAAGLVAIPAPLLAIEPEPWDPPAPAEFDAILFGSTNAIRHGGPALARFRHLPAYAVGEATANTAREAGFSVAAIGAGSLQALLDDVVAAGHRRALRIAGVERVPLQPPSQLAIETAVVYGARALPLPPDVVALMRAGGIALVHSAAAARALAASCAKAGVERGALALACLSPRIADAAGGGWAAVEVAATPDDAALLALAGQMCQDRRFGATDHNH